MRLPLGQLESLANAGCVKGKHASQLAVYVCCFGVEGWLVSLAPALSPP